MALFRGRIRTLLLGGAIGAAIAYFFDPERGRGRRTKTRDMVGARVRRGAREASRQAEFAAGHAYGAVQEATRTTPENTEPDDNTLKAKVETELFGDPSIPKGDIVVNVVEGVVELRGQVGDGGQIRQIEERVRSIYGVDGVNNFLHLPETDAPNKAAAREASTS